MFKRVLSLLLTIVLLLSLAAVVPARAAGNKLIALTFDDGPGAHTERLLDGLAQRNVKVTFFMVGNCVKSRIETVKRVYNEGHQIANHSYDHSDLTDLSDSEVVSQITRTNELLDQACGSGTRYLVRAPYGSTNERVRSLVGAPLVYWSVDPQDWLYRDATTVKNHIVSHAADGAIILLHDIHSTSVDGALAAIDALKAQGYEFVTVKELFRRRGVKMENGTSYVKCSPTGTDLGPVEAPTIEGSAADGKLLVTLTSPSGADVYYTTDGSDVNKTSKRYTGPFTVNPPCTIKAVAAYELNGSRSSTVEKVFPLPVAMDPVLQVKDGVMTLTTQTKGASLYYTLDGTVANASSAKYNGPVTLTPGVVISACAGGEGLMTSRQVRATYSHLGNLFRDVYPNDWFYSAMDQAAAMGCMEGMGKNLFYPRDNVTRAQLVMLLYRYSGQTVTPEALASCPFTDVPADRWYTDAVRWAKDIGIVDGYGDNTFKPDKYITRQEMCKILSQYLTLSGNVPLESDGCADHYKDRHLISDWALPYVERMSACGIFLGNANGCFGPLNNATRAEAATVLVRLADLDKSQPPVTPEEPGTPEDPTAPQPSEPENSMKP